jgi:hypothetical protein
MENRHGLYSIELNIASHENDQHTRHYKTKSFGRLVLGTF